MPALGCEGDLAATSVTPLITKVDSADLAAEAGVPFPLITPRVSLPKLHAWSKRTTFPDRAGHAFG